MKGRTKWAHGAFLLAGLGLLAYWKPWDLEGRRGLSWSQAEAPPSPPVTDELLRRGADLYRRDCALCHGADGKGDGSVSQNYDTRPRDLTTGIYKLKSSPPGTLPADSDIFRTLTAGVLATSMPSFRDLPPEDRWALVHHLKSLAAVEDDEGNRFQLFEIQTQGEPIPMRPPYPFSAEAAHRGRKVYLNAKCDTCHGDQGGGDGPNAPGTKDDWGRPIRPTDLREALWFKGGSRPADIYRAISVGIPGTPMPASQSFPENERWDLAYYVWSLGNASSR